MEKTRERGSIDLFRGMGSEGIVAKRRDKPYRSGRSPDWIMVKNPDAPAATRGCWTGNAMY
jgi:ATP-dependent DNA ligase